MPIPHRNFTDFYHIAAHGYGASSFNSFDKWLNDHVTEQIVGLKKHTGALWERYDLLYKGTTAQGWGVIDGADGVMAVCTSMRLLPPYFNSHPITLITLNRRGTLYRNLDDWDPATGTGRYTDGLSAQYFDYPHDYHAGDNNTLSWYSNIPVPAVPTQMDIWHEAYNGAANDALAFKQRNYILTRGMIFGISYLTPDTTTWTNGQGLFMNVNIEHVRIKYFNPVVNAFSRYQVPLAGGVPLVLSGLGLHNDEDEIDEGGTNRFAESGTYWLDYVDYIYIEDLAGTVVATLQVDIWGAPGSRQFTYGSNTGITIYSLPPLPKGVYQLRLKKNMAIAPADDCEAYAGDWRCSASGDMRSGERLYLYYGDVEPGGPITRTKWRWKKGANYVFRYYAPIDVRAPEVFYEGMILSMSSFSRGTNDATGLPIFGDMEVELDNTTREFSKLLAEYWVKNQLVEIYYGYQNEPDVWKDTVFRGIVTDYQKPGVTWKVTLRDIMEKYFLIKIPRYRCMASEYPNIHPNHEGREMPEVLGLASLTTGSTKGAVEAIYVDTTAFKYLAARGSLYDVTEVYKDSVLVAPADYTIVYADGGRTYIVFDHDQGDAKITFNCQGYTYVDWDDPDSTGPYVRNPIRIIEFVLAFFAEVPDVDVDLDAFDDLAATYDTLGYGQAGYLILQDERDVSSVMQELLYTFGAKTWITYDGKITIGRKDPTDLTVSAYYFEQIDALAEPERPTGFDAAVNYAPVSWQYYPTANYYLNALLATRQSSIDAFEAQIMPGSDWNFMWTDSAALVADRCNEDLLKFGFGDQRIKLPVSIQHIFDLDVLDNFRFQDPYGLDTLGVGEVGRYFYAERFTYDLLGGRMDIDGIDLQWLIRQYFLLGDEVALAANWSSATETDRIWGYLADELTGSFADGEPGKVLIDENIGG